MKKTKQVLLSRTILSFFTVLIFSFMVFTLVLARIGDPHPETAVPRTEVTSVQATYNPAKISAYDMSFLREIPIQEIEEEIEDAGTEVQSLVGQDSKSSPETQLPKTGNEAPQSVPPEKEQEKSVQDDKTPVDAPEPGNLPVEEPSQPTKKQGLNEYVLSIIETYEIGRYPYLLNTDYNNYNGVTMDLFYKGKIIAKANLNGNRASHCVGITFEVFTRAMRERNRSLDISEDDFNGMTWEELHDFMLTWYVASGTKTNNNLAAAVEKYGLGRRITDFEQAKPGDFIDISRENGTGHAAVFIDWVRENDKIIGLKYWSSQPSTKGINYNVEYFNVKKPNNAKYGNVRTDHVYIARIFPVDEYKKLR